MSEERRKSVLTESDFEKIGEVFERRQAQLFEAIGYNVSTHESRDEIRTDHKFVRYFRKSALWASGAAIAAYIGAAAAGWVP